MIGLKFTDNNPFVDLDLFSIHYPPLTSVSDMCFTKSLKSNSSAIPLDFKFDSVIETCLKKLNFDTKSIITKNILGELVQIYKDGKVITLVLFYQD